MTQPNLRSSRARRARLGKAIGRVGYAISVSLALIGFAGATALFITGSHYGYSALGFGLAFVMPAVWWKFDLSVVPIEGKSLDGRLSRDLLVLLNPTKTYSPQDLFSDIQDHWQVRFICYHLLLLPDTIKPLLSPDTSKTEDIWAAALAEADTASSPSIEPSHLVTALLQTSPDVQTALQQSRLSRSDVEAVAGWLQRDLDTMNRKKHSYGGIGRDWANGFTPRLNQFGHNLSLAIESNNVHFGSLVESPGVLAIKDTLSKGSTAIALVGPHGIGKTSHAYALAQNLLAETKSRRLEHHQMIALEASAIISAATHPGELEYIINLLLNETLHAGNIILFLDDSQLFFQAGPGTFNATQILLPFIQSRSVPIIFAMTDHDLQQLKSTNLAFASLLTPIVLQEPSEDKTLKILADTASTLESKQGLLIAYEAIKETYRLSGRYDLDMAFPGKAINLLEQSLTHSEGQVVNVRSVQAAIEQTTGAKTGSAEPIEASELLNLEAKIHERMINQSRAVSVVANALRRNRAGVANPNRPIGSFLFLGPTGVGKTELAKAITATYFHSETNLIRLDMSEYQQESDVARLLSDGETETSSLILRVRQQPFSVVLFDEIEKAHPNILNLLLQLLDEGQLTDVRGRKVSFKDTVVIVTSNAGADSIRERIEKGEELENFESQFIDQLIESGQFKPELLNRFDEIVLFRPLKANELGQIVRLMLGEINKTLANQNINVELTDAAVAKIVEVGNDPRLGARPMRRTLQKAVENTVAEKILKGDINPGDSVILDTNDLSI
ncbi:MAG: AAA family ATPase [Candidatus Saccharimonadales bacterium]